MLFLGLSAALLVAPIVAAHGDLPGVPKIIGLGLEDMGKLKSRNILGGHASRADRHKQRLSVRQEGGVDGRCGPDNGCGVCAQGYCCSPEGWCGQGRKKHYERSFMRNILTPYLIHSGLLQCTRLSLSVRRCMRRQQTSIWRQHPQHCSSQTRSPTLRRRGHLSLHGARHDRHHV
jgi:hypothetical protein